MSIWRTSLREIARSALSRVVAALAKPHVEEAVNRAVQEALETGPLDEDYGYRATGWTERDLTPIAHDTVLKMIRWLWASSPEVRRAFEIRRDFVVSEGLEVKATSTRPEYAAAVQAVVDAHLKDPVNLWPERFGQRVLELGAFGDWIVPAWVNPHDGGVILGFIAPENIERIDADPLRAEQMRSVRLKVEVDWESPDGTTSKRRDLRVIHHNPATGRLEGDVFLCQVNRLSGATRGLSDALPAADWADRLHQLVHSEADRVLMLKAFIWDVTLKDANEIAVQKWRKRWAKPPKPGSVRVHNDGETWQAVAPETKSYDTLAFLKFILTRIFGSLGIPLHFFADSENINRSSAKEMTDPVYATVRERQLTVCTFLRQILQFALEQAAERGRLRVAVDGAITEVPLEERTFEVTLREPDRRQYELIGEAANQVANALAKAVANRWITNREAAERYRKWLVGAFGFTLPDEVPDSVDQGPDRDELQRVVALTNDELGRRRTERERQEAEAAAAAA